MNPIKIHAGKMLAAKHVAVLALFCSLFAGTAAQAQDYGSNVTLEQARTVIAAAEAEAVKQNFNVAIAVVDTAGNLVAFVKRDNTQNGSVQVAQGKASTAALYKRPSKALQDTLAQGGAGLRVLGLTGVIPVEGGLPLVVGGVIVGAVGVSGVTSEQDSMVATAGAAALK
jgi:glc operon protein GlcG